MSSVLLCLALYCFQHNTVSNTVSTLTQNSFAHLTHDHLCFEFFFFNFRFLLIRTGSLFLTKILIVTTVNCSDNSVFRHSLLRNLIVSTTHCYELSLFRLAWSAFRQFIVLTPIDLCFCFKDLFRLCSEQKTIFPDGLFFF